MIASKLREWMGRAALVSLGLVAMSAGLALGSTACFCDCPDLDPVRPGVFEVVESPVRPELVGAIVDATGEIVTVSFTDAEGNSWVIDYSIAYKD
jgi:hypothetical protein